MVLRNVFCCICCTFVQRCFSPLNPQRSAEAAPLEAWDRCSLAARSRPRRAGVFPPLCFHVPIQYVTYSLPVDILHMCNGVMNSRGHQRHGMILLSCRNEQNPLWRWSYCCHRDGKIKPADYKSLNWISTLNNKRCTDNRWEWILKMKTRVGTFLPLSEASLKGFHVFLSILFLLLWTTLT